MLMCFALYECLLGTMCEVFKHILYSRARGSGQLEEFHSQLVVIWEIHAEVLSGILTSWDTHKFCVVTKQLESVWRASASLITAETDRLSDWKANRWMDGWMDNNNNNNNNLLHFYSVFLGVQSALHSKGDISSSTTNVQHPPGWCDSSHIAPERPPQTSLLVERRQWWSQSVYGDDLEARMVWPDRHILSLYLCIFVWTI